MTRYFDHLTTKTAMERHTLYADRPLSEFIEFVDTNIAANNRGIERLPVEMRQAARHGKCADVDQRFDRVGLEDGNQLVEGARGVTDGVKSGHGR